MYVLGIRPADEVFLCGRRVWRKINLCTGRSFYSDLLMSKRTCLIKKESVNNFW